ncbi:MAG: hypothetical protein AB7P03_02630 [Kofleriaceae bacterium]
MTLPRFIAVMTLFAACTTERDVFTEGPTAPITSCDAVWSRGVEGAACDLADVCQLSTRDGCCTGFASCVRGQLFVSRTCRGDCVPGSCSSDTECTYGITLCSVQSTCTVCPDVNACPAPCAEDEQRAVANGCQICMCIPR